MLKIRQRGAFKPYGAPVSIIEMALWDVAGKAAGVPVYKLLGGKVRDKVRTYNGSLRVPMGGTTPEHYAADCKRMMALPEGFDIVKQGIGFHSTMKRDFKAFTYGEINASPFHGQMDQGLITERAMNHMIDCVIAMKEALGDKVGSGARLRPRLDADRRDALRQGRREVQSDVARGSADRRLRPLRQRRLYRDLTMQTSTPIHTGEQIYLRNNFKELIEKHAVNIVGPDPADVGGIAELKWIAEYAAPAWHPDGPPRHRQRPAGPWRADQVCATLPANYIAFEYPSGTDPWWYEIVDRPAQEDREQRA